MIQSVYKDTSVIEGYMIKNSKNGQLNYSLNLKVVLVGVIIWDFIEEK